jgi:hypothetical protein
VGDASDILPQALRYGKRLLLFANHDFPAAADRRFDYQKYVLHLSFHERPRAYGP